MPEVLIITPESLHLLLAQKNYPDVFKSLKIIAVDEWHELIGSKRGVQVELAISRIVGSRGLIVNSQKSEAGSDLANKAAIPLTPPHSLPTTHHSPLSLWGISATIGNLEQAKDVLMDP